MKDLRSKPQVSFLRLIPHPLRKLFAWLILTLIFAGALVIDTYAATFAVTNLNDSGAGSLRQAILDAKTLPGDDAIIFQNGLTGTVSLTSGELLIDSNLTITGAGSNLLTVGRDPQATTNFRIFNIATSTTVSINGITVSGGRLEPAAFGGTVNGGGIFNAGTLNLTDVKITDNSTLRTQNVLQTSNAGGGIYNTGTLALINSTVSGNSANGWITNNGGGIYSTGTLTLTNTVISGNQATSATGGLGNSGTARGGGIYGNFTMTNSTVSGNTSRGRSAYGGGISGGGTIINSTVSDNTASCDNNGETAGGGLIGDAEVINSTFSNNLATNISGFGSRGGAMAVGSGTAIKNSTVVGNRVSGGTPQNGGGISGSPTIKNTIIAQNTISNSQPGPNAGGPNVFGTVVSQGHNLIDDATGSSGWAAADLLNQNPLLAPLGNYGGPTATYALLPDSPAVNGGDNNGAPATDQRGAVRIAGGTIDIGAFENNVVISPDTLPNAVYNTPYNQMLSAQRLSGFSEQLFSASNQYLLNQLPPFGFGILSGNLPSGLNLSAIGNITGSPSVAGTFGFTVKATDADGMAGVRKYSITIPCSYSINPTGAQFPMAGGNGSFNVFAPAACTWTAVSDSPWVTVTGGNSGSGNGPVMFSVGNNNSGAARTASITVAGQAFVVNQAVCTYNISPTSFNTTAAGGSSSFNVTSQVGCGWTATSNDSWITVTNGSGTENGTVSFTVGANTGPARTGSIMVAGQTFTVNQTSGCLYSLSSSAADFMAAGGNGSVNVLSGVGCQWTATSNNSWIHVTSGASGSGNGTVNFAVDSNSGPNRTGTLTIAGNTFTVNQTAPCQFTLSANGASFPASGGSGSFNITANNSNCSWTASTTSQWISIVGENSGTGNGSVSFSIQVNVNPGRTGSINVGGQSFLIEQANGCVYTLSAASSNFPSSGGAGNFNINAGAACSWTALSNSQWIVIISGSSGVGNGTISFTVQPNQGVSRSGVITAGGAAFTINQASPIRPLFDFDGDGKADVGIFRPSDGSWWYTRSSANDYRVYAFGTDSDIMTPGDFTGDGKADIAVFRPSNGNWYIQRSEDNSFFSFPFGAAGDIPAPADYDNDGKTDAAVYRPSVGTWFILNSGGTGTSIVQFGTAEDKPVPADFDGDGKADIAIFRPSDGSWWYLQSSNSQFKVYRFGVGTDKPVPGDFTGDGKADIAVFRPSTGEWFFQRSEDNSYYSVPFGASGDIPAPGDYDGDGRFDTAVFRPSNGDWYVQRSTAGILITNFGANGDRPIPNSFVP